MKLNLLDILFEWHVRPGSEAALAAADVIVTHEMGDQHTVSTATAEIVRIALELRQRYSKPWIAQFPGNEAIPGGHPFAVVQDHKLKKDAYLDTEEVSRQVAEICNANGWKCVVLITHPHHSWRAFHNLRHHNLIPMCPDLRSVKYDRDCPRLALRYAWIFIPREIIARIIYWRDGYLA